MWGAAFEISDTQKELLEKENNNKAWMGQTAVEKPRLLTAKNNPSGQQDCCELVDGRLRTSVGLFTGHTEVSYNTHKTGKIY